MHGLAQAPRIRGHAILTRLHGFLNILLAHVLKLLPHGSEIIHLVSHVRTGIALGLLRKFPCGSEHGTRILLLIHG